MRGRFAPSPTGRMHVGNARTALLAWLQVRAAGGSMVMRIEDLDRGRCRSHFEQLVLDDLTWLGLDWDEGPYRQSERDAIYQAALARLDVYPCTCTRKELRDAAGAPHGREPVYPGTCRDGPTQPHRPASLRWRVPTGTVRVDDALAGVIEHDLPSDVGDVVLRRNDGAWAYQLAVVVDDAAMGITHVLRGEDLLSSTPRQVALQRALGFATPRYAHVPLVRGQAGEKLSKRDRPADLGTLRDRGVDPQALVAAMARSVGLDVPDRMTPAGLVEGFSLEGLRDASPLDLRPLT